MGKIFFVVVVIGALIVLFGENGKKQDKKDPNQLTHAAKMSDLSYAPEGSDRYKDKHGKTTIVDKKKKK